MLGLQIVAVGRSACVCISKQRLLKKKKKGFYCKFYPYLYDIMHMKVM